MEIITTVRELKKCLHLAKKQGKTVGLVPTMGYLHEGHLTLMRKAREENDCVVASIFVNPLQFGQGEDFESYPRDLKQDSLRAASVGVDWVFAPKVAEMYPQGFENMNTFVEVSGVTAGLCGASRPGHFRGVATVVSKLFHIVEPDRAYFGQKDAQQVVVIQKMVQDLNMNVTIVPVPIVREADGLALSSRNLYLGSAERQAALVLSQSLQLATKLLESGVQESDKILQQMTELIQREPLAALEYLVIVDKETLESVSDIQGPILIAMAVRIGKTRLIDNIIWRNA
ncbi:pantoate--beta-alanine ligase [Sporomusaceae bacterium BoRhaA]|uniref:pantoate--beta-alanine ligase n=1 Tax=Pelorhabdus rhamnosifermentans TaxID=2772457 RepID=UPI001C060C51|nr:pantoate--beta-alanine ligase [Pelorhabdus rhamnosifermentans]MBU2700667.1 pantoate--beta-alanine ligase [Pelorhabdus rhamnosifermentans]